MNCFYCDKSKKEVDWITVDEMTQYTPCEDCFLRMVIWMPHKVRLRQNAMADKAESEGK